MELEVVDVVTHTRPTVGRAFARGAVMFGVPIVVDVGVAAVERFSSYGSARSPGPRCALPASAPGGTASHARWCGIARRGPT
jgi:hypothetical protein